MKHFWPGPLTLLFPCDSTIVPAIVTANQPTVAIRMPSHPVARALIAVANAPIAAPSANLSGKPSPTQARHVLRDLDGKVGLILDGGACDVGVESTVVDGLNDDGNLRVLRPGGVTVEDIQRVLREDMQDFERLPEVLVHRRDFTDASLEQAPTTPGMKYRHYSPAVPVILLHTSSPPDNTARVPALALLASLKHKITAGPRSTKIGILTPSDSQLGQCVLPGDGIHWRRFFLGPASTPSVIAHRLFDGFLTLENEGVDLIVVEAIPEEKEGLAVMNRVKKAASESIWIDLAPKPLDINHRYVLCGTLQNL
jgi:L-threonylcarbamoyladenylate synthase